MNRVLAFFVKSKIGKYLLLALVLTGSFAVSNQIISNLSYRYDQLGEKNKPQEVVKKEWTRAKLPPEVEEATKDWKTYTSMADPKNRFEIRYPKGWYTYPPQGRNPFDTITNFAGYNEDTNEGALSNEQAWVCFSSMGYRAEGEMEFGKPAGDDNVDRNYKIADVTVTRITVAPFYSDITPGDALEPGNYIYIIPDRNNRNKFLRVQTRPKNTTELATIELMLATARNLAL